MRSNIRWRGFVCTTSTAARRERRRDRTTTVKKISFNPEHKRALDAMLLKIADVQPGKMFGYPGYYVNGKLFACVMDDAIAVKVPEARARALIAADGAEIEPFRPMGTRTMKEWVQIRRKDSTRYLADEAIFRASIAFVAAARHPTPRRRTAAGAPTGMA
jgi:TfoX/Sxy family transcriptional regulator of competence genes